MAKAKQNFFKKPSTVRASGIIALAGGFYFMGTNFTGNAIRETPAKFSILSIMGILLLACSAVLIIYSFRKK